MAATPETRAKFVESVIRFLEEYDLDGVDMDWEYPGLPGAGNPHMDADRENFTALMKELREAMDATGKTYVLTFASAGWEKYYDYVDLEEVMKYADYMNVMTYDLVGGNTPVTGHHTNLGWIRVEDLNFRWGQNICRSDNTFTAHFQVQPGGVNFIQLEPQLFQLQHNLDHIFAHTRNAAELVLHVCEADGCNCRAIQRRKQHTS